MLLPPGATRDAAVLLAARALRGFGDGMVAVTLPAYLAAVGLSDVRIGAVVTATLVGSAALTLAVGLGASRARRGVVLAAASALMAATGVGFAAFDAFWALVVVGFVGTLNPSGGDVSVFLPTEQSILSFTAPDSVRTALYARYTLAGQLAAAAGSLAAGGLEWAGAAAGLAPTTALRAVFAAYAGLGVAALVLYRRLSPELTEAGAGGPGAARRGAPRAALGPSRGIVLRLAALFSLDSLGGGFIVQSLLALWLFRRFDLSVAAAGAIFFWTGVLSAFSALAAARIAGRIGLVRTMVYTHLPANGLLVLTPFAPNLAVAIALLLARSLLSNMDVPVRTSYVMAVVTPAERPAAASVTNVPRSLASAGGPLLAGWLLGVSGFGWPLLIGGGLKAVYDLALLAMFRSVRPPEEAPLAQDPAPTPPPPGPGEPSSTPSPGKPRARRGRR
ncbi:MAG: MFS transporter [Acidimicrobiales bacterium]